MQPDLLPIEWYAVQIFDWNGPGTGYLEQRSIELPEQSDKLHQRDVVDNIYSFATVNEFVNYIGNVIYIYIVIHKQYCKQTHSKPTIPFKRVLRVRNCIFVTKKKHALNLKVKLCCVVFHISFSYI